MRKTKLRKHERKLKPPKGKRPKPQPVPPEKANAKRTARAMRAVERGANSEKNLERFVRLSGHAPAEAATAMRRMLEGALAKYERCPPTSPEHIAARDALLARLAALDGVAA